MNLSFNLSAKCRLAYWRLSGRRSVIQTWSSTSFLNASRAAGRTFFPLTMTPSMSNMIPKSGSSRFELNFRAEFETRIRVEWGTKRKALLAMAQAILLTLFILDFYFDDKTVIFFKRWSIHYSFFDSFVLSLPLNRVFRVLSWVFLMTDWSWCW